MTYLTKLSIFQNIAIRHVIGGKHNDHPTPIYSNLKILKLFDFYELETAKIVHGNFSKILLTLLSNL